MPGYEAMTDARKQAFLDALRAGHSFRQAAVMASQHATLVGARSSFRWAMQNDPDFALRVAKVRAGR